MHVCSLSSFTFISILKTRSFILQSKVEFHEGPHSFKVSYTPTWRTMNRVSICIVPEELRMEVCNTVQEVHPQEKEIAKRQNGCLRMPYKQLRREAKGKGKKERYIHLNAEFQWIARRDKKAVLSVSAKKQRKTIEWERLEIYSRKLEIQREYPCKDGHDKGQKW